MDVTFSIATLSIGQGAVNCRPGVRVRVYFASVVTTPCSVGWIWCTPVMKNHRPTAPAAIRGAQLFPPGRGGKRKLGPLPPPPPPPARRGPSGPRFLKMSSILGPRRGFAPGSLDAPFRRPAARDCAARRLIRQSIGLSIRPRWTHHPACHPNHRHPSGRSPRGFCQPSPARTSYPIHRISSCILYRARDAEKQGLRARFCC